MSVQKIALVTGGSRGLGRNMAMKLAEKGSDVIITYHQNVDMATEVTSEIQALGRKAYALQLDTGDTAGFAAFFQNLRSYLLKEYGKAHIDHLINNAGTGAYSTFEETVEDVFDAMVNIHLKGVYFFTQKALTFLNDGGSVVNISSGLARFAFPGYSAYGTVKGGVETMTRYMAKELGGRQINVNTVAPGAIETDFGGGQVRDNADLNAQIASLTTLGRVGLPDDIGGVVAFLCSEEAHWITGQRIEVSGGMLL